MSSYGPGSFTKNFAWGTGSAGGLSRLYDVIRAGFSGEREGMTRDLFRRQCGIEDTNRQLIPINFFLHNTIDDQTNYLTIDELVRHALNNTYSRRFDELALFAFHLSRMGRRYGVAGTEYGAKFANDFIREDVWHNGGWPTNRLTDDFIESAFERTIQAAGDDTVHKCVTNYAFMLDQMKLRLHGTETVNTRIDEWIGPGLFLAFDRFWSDQARSPTRSELLAMVGTDELHKLMGVPRAYVDTAAPLILDEYLALGGPSRTSEVAAPETPGSPTVTSPTRAGGGVAQRGHREPLPARWSDQAAEDVAIVLRRMQEVQAQIRNASNVRRLKAIYNNTCLFCNKQIVVSVNPNGYYSEAAHIKPVGLPHNGPDSRNNMLILCPEHHLQFDRGILRIKAEDGRLTLHSKVPGDQLNGIRLNPNQLHVLDEQYIIWHFEYWS